MTEQPIVSLYPDKEEARRILCFIMAAGKTLLESGAEVFRVEQTMQHMAKGYHLREFDVYVITNGIFVSAGAAELSEIRNVAKRTVHLGRVAAVNALSRKITAGQLSIADAEIGLVQAQKLPEPSPKSRILASAFGAFGFCFLFQGTTLDALVSLLAGALLGAYLCACDTRGVSAMFQRLTGAGLVTAVCLLATWGLPTLHIQTSSAIIGALMILTPGVTFTMAIRDLVHSDYLSGAIRMMDALIISASIAIGAGLVLWVESLYYMT